MNQLQLTPQQQQAFNNQLFTERDKITMSWTNELREWHEHALHALRFTSSVTLQVSPDIYRRLLQSDVHGINLNVVGILVNNMEARTPFEMQKSVERWADILELNIKIAQHWNDLAAPVALQVKKEFEIMQGKPKMVIAQA